MDGSLMELWISIIGGFIRFWPSIPNYFAIASYFAVAKHLIHLWGRTMQGMMTSSNGNIFRITDPLCGESPVTDEFPSQRPVTRSFDVFFDLRLKKKVT